METRHQLASRVGERAARNSSNKPGARHCTLSNSLALAGCDHRVEAGAGMKCSIALVVASTLACRLTLVVAMGEVAPPAITTQPQSQTVVQGGDTTFSASNANVIFRDVGRARTVTIRLANNQFG